MMKMPDAGLHNNIASYATDRSGLCTGTLIFGVGLRNEPATLAGITHLVEHVVLYMAEHFPLHLGGVVDEDSVKFHATGDAEEVAQFLNAVAAAVSGFSSVPEEVFSREKSVIEAEDPSAFCTVSNGLLTNRFGASGLGASQMGASSTTGIRLSEAVEWVERWFTAENAAVTFSGRIPESLDIRLPSGRAQFRETHSQIIDSPTVVRSPKAGVAFSLLVPTVFSSLLGEALYRELHSRLRRTRGLIYSVTVLTTRIDEHRNQLDLVLDPLPANVRTTFGAGMAALEDIAKHGFSGDAVEFARNALRVELAWEDGIASTYLDQLAVDGLLGRSTPTLDELHRRIAVQSGEELTSVLGGALPTLLVAVDSNFKIGRKDAAAWGLASDPFDIWQREWEQGVNAPTEVDLDGLTPWRNKSGKAALWLTTDRLVKKKGGKTRSIDLSEVAVVGSRQCGCISLTARRGRSTEFVPDDWKRAKSLRRALLRSFPAEIVREFPEE
ncbi:hypothetical protein ACSYDW_00355 [Paeniglutamicibacter sp. R2-26]|uniref:hypothetical protein n=1 Tax=Paeniglutamicibacter sp. R2-26 TaxID=3144417 RepID=UPI003EE79EC1